MSREAQALICLALLACASGTSAAHPVYHPRRNLAQAMASFAAAAVEEDGPCRVETACENQQCSPAAYQFDLATAGPAVPYTVNHTITGGDTQSTFVFLVCSTAQLQESCAGRQGAGCSPLEDFQIRTRNDVLENGRANPAEPAGTPWTSCFPHGPGYRWRGAALGELATAVPGTSNDACTVFTITGGYSTPDAPASLSDICQQNVTVTNTKNGKVILDTTGSDGTCVFTLKLASGRTAYGVLGLPAPEPAEEEEELIQPAVDDVGPHPDTAEAGVDDSPSEQVQRGPSPYGPGAHRRRRLRGMRVGMRLF